MLRNMINNLGKKVLIVLAVPSAKNILSKLASKVTSSVNR